jgi:hypothetical protein
MILGAGEVSTHSIFRHVEDRAFVAEVYYSGAIEGYVWVRLGGNLRRLVDLLYTHWKST